MTTWVVSSRIDEKGLLIAYRVGPGVCKVMEPLCGEAGLLALFRFKRARTAALPSAPERVSGRPTAGTELYTSAIHQEAMIDAAALLTLFLEFQSTSALPCANTPASHPPIPLPTLRASPNSPPSGTQSPLGASMAKYGTPLGFSGSSDIGLESVEASARSSIPRKTMGGREAGRRAASKSLERSLEAASSDELEC